MSEHNDAEYEPHEFLLHDKWRQLFDQFDPEGFGEIPCQDFLVALSSPELKAQIEPAKQTALTAKACQKGKTSITFEEFIDVVSGKRTPSFKMAVAYGSHSAEKDFQRKMVNTVAAHYLHDEKDRKYYADHYNCCPPPFFILTISLAEFGFFLYYLLTTDPSTSTHVPVDSIFIYRPDKKAEVWRFFLYMLLHSGWPHLFFNLMVQLLVGLPLEMVHGSLRIGTVYIAGVLAGSLGASVFDSHVYLIGASGGVYALLTAHLANVVLNHDQMRLGFLRVVGVIAIASADFGYAIYERFAKHRQNHPVAFVPHLAGAGAGVSIGLLVLKNFEQRLHEQLIWWITLSIYGVCTVFAVLYNLLE